MRALHTGIRVLATVLVGVLTVVMIRLTLRPTWPGTPGQLAFLLGVVGSGWLGGAGVLTSRPAVTAVGATGLVLLGFWQATLWVVMIPTALALGIASVTTPANGATTHS